MRLPAAAVDASGARRSRRPGTPRIPGCTSAAATPRASRSTPRFWLRPRYVVLAADEAGMSSTRLLDRVLTDATTAGAVVRLLGDPHFCGRCGLRCLRPPAGALVSHDNAR
ncbi:AAA family ATPase [Streptomyces sp. NPDC001406]|uniref:AAA family ATPase n=1 Tax=Streptomyces sp. NPDC001406 TaxID=3364572 RepID=UPI00369F48B5